MSAPLSIQFFPSQFPECLEQARERSWETGKVDPRLHYEGYRQSQRWLRLHEAHSPARTRQDTMDLYDRALPQIVEGDWSAWVALGCGGGHKESQWILNGVRLGWRFPALTLVDCAAPLLMDAARRVVAAGGAIDAALSLDLSRIEEVGAIPHAAALEGGPRLYSCFGVTPNMDLKTLGAALWAVMRAGDGLAINANLLETHEDEDAVLAGYDNALTRQWLGGFLEDSGLDWAFDRFRIDLAPGEPRSVRVDYPLDDGRVLELFFSNRFTTEGLGSWLEGLGLRVQWLSPSVDRTEALAYAIKPRGPEG